VNEEELLDWTTGAERVVLTSCNSCLTTWYLPHENCPSCQSRRFSRSEAAGEGLCVAVTALHVTAEAEAPGPLELALVELDEGPVMMGRVRGPLRPGDRARLEFVTGMDDRLLPSFARGA